MAVRAERCRADGRTSQVPVRLPTSLLLSGHQSCRRGPTRRHQSAIRGRDGGHRIRLSSANRSKSQRIRHLFLHIRDFGGNCASGQRPRDGRVDGEAVADRVGRAGDAVGAAEAGRRAVRRAALQNSAADERRLRRRPAAGRRPNTRQQRGRRRRPPPQAGGVRNARPNAATETGCEHLAVRWLAE